MDIDRSAVVPGQRGQRRMIRALALPVVVAGTLQSVLLLDDVFAAPSEGISAEAGSAAQTAAPVSGVAPAPAPGVAAATPAQLREARGVVEGDFRIGPTGILCAKAPCPWRGIVSLNGGGRRPGWPIWSGEVLPPVSGRRADRDRIAKAWRDQACLVVEGRFAGGGLEVREVKGDC